MQYINSDSSLRAAILQLEARQSEEVKMLRAQFCLVYESVKPINLIKSTFKEAAESLELRENILNTSVGLSVGYLSKMLFVGMSHNPVKKMLGNVLLFGITNVVAKNPEAVKSLGHRILNLIRSRSRRHSNGPDMKAIEGESSYS